MVVDDDVIFSVFKKYCKVCNRSQVILTTIINSRQARYLGVVLIVLIVPNNCNYLMESW